MTVPEEYAFKPAVLSSEQTWTIKDGHLMRRGGKSAFPIAKTDRANWGDLAYRGTRSAWLHLSAGEDTVKLNCNDNGSGDDRRVFLQLIGAVLSELSDSNPGLEIRHDGGGPFGRAMFVLLSLGALFGAAFIAAVIAGAVNQNQFIVIGIGLLMLFGMGSLAWTYRPWQAPMVATPDDLRQLLSSKMR